MHFLDIAFLGFAPQARARPVQRWHHTGEAGFTHRLHHQHREQIRLRQYTERETPVQRTQFESNSSGSGGALILQPPFITRYKYIT